MAAPIAPYVPVADDALEVTVVARRLGAPTARVTDWLCGTADYLEGGLW